MRRRKGEQREEEKGEGEGELEKGEVEISCGGRMNEVTPLEGSSVIAKTIRPQVC